MPFESTSWRGDDALKYLHTQPRPRPEPEATLETLVEGSRVGSRSMSCVLSNAPVPAGLTASTSCDGAAACCATPAGAALPAEVLVISCIQHGGWLLVGRGCRRTNTSTARNPIIAANNNSSAGPANQLCTTAPTMAIGAVRARKSAPVR